MKSIVLSVLAAAALTLGACSHTAKTAALNSVPVASLTPEEIHAELALISQRIDDLAAVSKEELRRENDQRRMVRTISRVSDSSVVGSVEPQIVSYSPPFTELQALQNRRNKLRTQLARAGAPES